MGIIKRKIIELALRDFYKLKDLDHPKFGEELHNLKVRKGMTSEPPALYRRLMNIKTCHIDNSNYYILHSKKNKKCDSKVIYIHGGGLVSEAFPSHWEFCRRLADKTGCEIIFPAYPLVPEGNTVLAHDMLFKVYKKVLENTDPAKLVMIGDSAGGTLSLSLSMMARDEGLPVVREIILISPGFAMENLTDKENAHLQEIKKHDFMIGQFPVRKIAELWNGGAAPLDYRTDVTRGSIEGLPFITMFSGTFDIMNIAARRFARRLKKENHPYRYIEKKGGYHVYVLSRKSAAEFNYIASKVVNDQ